MNELILAQGASPTARNITIVLFLIFVLITLGITIWASRQTRNATDFYAGRRSFSGFQNGLAIGGVFMSSASLLGITGLIALFGFVVFLYFIRVLDSLPVCVAL